MPGHVKLGASNEPDPDPAPFLIISPEMRREAQAKPYDAKKSVWAPDGEGGFVEALLEGEHGPEGGKTTVMVGHEKKTFKAEEVGPVNPPKFEKCEDMANLSFLNEGSVFYNLKTRYQAKLIYTYSGLFCIVVNPYKRFPIYTPTVVKMYLGKRRNEVPPHLWAITETAYRNMLMNSKDQSMLITGESGAGKTENTKKVIAYLAMVATSGKKSGNKVSLEDQIVATNPILESYGNAKTSRNDNSSRFGKFIRIHFNSSGKLAGCDIQSYLLEKSRITQQQEVERSYHIFYQLLQPFVPEMKSKCILGDDIYDYSYVSQGKTTVASIDDNEELEFTFDAFNIIGFSEEEKWDCFKITASVMTMGEIKFKQKGRDDQCEPDAMEIAAKVGTLFGIDPEQMMKSFCKPRIKVGTEWVTKGQNIEQATSAVGGIARATYARCFNWLIDKCNATLIDKTMKKINFVAVLDIAGFEIFEYNGFEQISINFVNEKLQQFFNHHMFVVEQEEYVREGIDWVMVDFGMDLAACIIMFEKPMGLWAILEEESLFPKATDKSFEEKLKASLGKLPVFAKAKSATDKNAHFAIVHYAGTVSYNITGWLEKNKDPVNDTVVDIMKKATCNLLVLLWLDHPGQSAAPEADKGGKGGKKKGGGGKTVSSVYLVQLSQLMTTLHSTEPHFIRCIVPNNHKQPGGVEPPLIMHQLTCNGVLEGIRICMRGFPNRILYDDFIQRYYILSGGQVMANEKDQMKGAKMILENTKGFDAEKYKIGKTKVFFRAGALALLEEKRDELVIDLIRYMQGFIRARNARAVFENKKMQRNLIKVIQRKIRQYQSHKNWGWFIIIQKTRPLIGLPNPEEELRVLEEKANSTWGLYSEQVETKKHLEEENVKVREEIVQLRAKLKGEQGDVGSYQERIDKLTAENEDLQEQITFNKQKLANEENQKANASEEKRSGEITLNNLKCDLQDAQARNDKLQQEKQKHDQALRGLNEEVVNQDESITKLNKEKKYIQESVGKSNENLSDATDKLSHLTEVKEKMESTLDQMENSIEREKRMKNGIEKDRRKVEGDLKMCQEKILDIERGNREVEQSVMRKDTEIAGLVGKLQDEQASMAHTQRYIKEIQSRIEEMEEELEAERQSHKKAEKQRADMCREYDEMTERLDESCVATATQLELNKKRVAEIAKWRKDLNEVAVQHEATLYSLRKKHQDSVSEMSEQMEQLNKIIQKFEKDKTEVKMRLNDIKSATTHVSHEKAVAEKNLKALDNQLQNIIKKIDENATFLADYTTQNNRTIAENSNLFMRLEDLLNNISMMQKTKITLTTQLDDIKRICDDEAKERQSLLGRYRTLEHEFDGVKEHFEDEQQQKDEAVRQCQKLTGEADMWRCKYENEAVRKIEELEMAKLKMQSRLAECENTMNNLNGKLLSLEKAKLHLQKEIDDSSHRLDQVNILYNQAEKRVKLMDKVIAEWKVKADNISLDLNSSQKETRNASSELFRIKNVYDEASSQLDEVRRENRTLSDEIKDIMDQISEGGRSIHEIEKQRNKLESEKVGIESALGDTESCLEQKENQNLRLNLELNQVRADIEKRIAEKEEEFEGTKRNHAKAMEQMQFAIEQESKTKAEAIRIRKKLELDVCELESSVDTAHMTNSDLQKNIKLLQERIREKVTDLEAEIQAKDQARDYMLNAERKAHTMYNAVEETKTMLEQADRARRQAEQDLSDANDQLADLTVQNQGLCSTKKKLESDLDDLKMEADEAQTEANTVEERCKKLMLDAATLADELRSEQENAQVLEREKHAMETKLKEVQTELDDAEASALKWGKKMVQKLEARGRELETEIDSEMRRCGDAHKNMRKTERGIKEYTFKAEEDIKNGERMQELMDKLQNQIRSYKKQLEEAETIASDNLTKYRKAQLDSAEAEQRADLTEGTYSKCKARSRSQSVIRDYY